MAGGVTQTVYIKPLSSNEAWQGRRFKSPKYKAFEKECLLKLKKQALPTPPFQISFTFGFSNKASDVDNPTKSILDILCKKLMFNDKMVYRLIIDKVIVPKGKEFFSYKIESLH